MIYINIISFNFNIVRSRLDFKQTFSSWKHVFMHMTLIDLYILYIQYIKYNTVFCFIKSIITISDLRDFNGFTGTYEEFSQH